MVLNFGMKEKQRTEYYCIW